MSCVVRSCSELECLIRSVHLFDNDEKYTCDAFSPRTWKRRKVNTKVLLVFVGIKIQTIFTYYVDELRVC